MASGTGVGARGHRILPETTTVAIAASALGLGVLLALVGVVVGAGGASVARTLLAIPLVVLFAVVALARLVEVCAAVSSTLVAPDEGAPAAVYPVIAARTRRPTTSLDRLASLPHAPQGASPCDSLARTQKPKQTRDRRPSGDRR